MNKVLGKQWKLLTDNEKIKYFELAEVDKSRYRRELDTYNQLMTSQGKLDKIIISRLNHHQLGRTVRRGSVDSSCTDSSSATLSNESNSISECPSNQTIYRPRTAYSHFCKQEKQFVTMINATNVKLQTVMGKYFSARWKTMSSEQKRLYDLLEEDDRVEAQQIHVAKRCRY